MEALASSIAASLATKSVGPLVNQQFNLDFQPYSKTSERTFQISDWATKQRGRQNQSHAAGGFAFKSEDTDMGFFTSTEKGSSQSKSRHFLKLTNQQRSVLPGGARTAGRRATRPGTRRTQETTSRFNANNNRLGNNRAVNRNFFRREEIQRGYSCPILPTWEQVQRFPLTTPNGTSLPRVTTLNTVGTVEVFNSEYKAITTKTQKQLNVTEHFSTAQVSLEKDPYIAEILKDADNLGEEATFVMTDVVASLLMNVQHTIQPWDLSVKINEQNIAFITANNTPNNIINQHLVDEAQSDRLPQEVDNINSIKSLATEATAASNNIRSLFTARGSEPHSFPQNLPVDETVSNTLPLNTAYIYRRFVLDDIAVIVRAPLHVHQHGKPETYIHIATLFEYDSSYGGYHVDYRKNVDTMFAATFSNELKTNTAFMHRVLCEALLGDAAEIKLAWVSRQNFKQPGKHTLLSVTSHPIQQFSSLLQSRKADYYEQLSTVLTELLLDAGEYTLLREPNERALSIFDCNGNVEEQKE